MGDQNGPESRPTRVVPGVATQPATRLEQILMRDSRAKGYEYESGMLDAIAREVEKRINGHRAHLAINAMRTIEPGKENELDALVLLDDLRAAEVLSTMIKPVQDLILTAKGEGVELEDLPGEFEILARALTELQKSIEARSENPAFTPIIQATVEVRAMITDILIREEKLKEEVKDPGRESTFNNLALVLDDESRAYLAEYYAKKAVETEVEDSSVAPELERLLPLHALIVNGSKPLHRDFTDGDLVALDALSIIQSISDEDGMDLERASKRFSRMSSASFQKRIAEYEVFAGNEEGLLALVDEFSAKPEPESKTQGWSGLRESPAHKTYMLEAKRLRVKIGNESRATKTLVVPTFAYGPSEESYDDIGYLKRIRSYLSQTAKIYRNLAAICNTLKDLSRPEDPKLQDFAANQKYMQLAEIFSPEGWPEFRGKAAPAD